MAIKKKKQDYFIGIFVLLLFIVFTFYNWPLLDKLDSYLYHTSSRLVKSKGLEKNNVVIINVNLQSASKSSQDNTSSVLNLSELTGKLTANGVKLIVFSAPFEADQSTLALQKLSELSDEINAYPPGKKFPEFRDWVLENIVKSKTRIISNNMFPGNLKNGSNIVFPVSDTGTESIDLGIIDYLNSANIDPAFIKENTIDKLAFPYSEILKNAAGCGYLARNVEKQPDNILSYPLYVVYKGSLVPSLALRSVIYYYDLKPAQVEADLSRVVLKDHVLPLINGRYVPLSGNDYQVKVISYKQLMESTKELPELKGKVAIISLKGGGSITDQDAGVVARQFTDIINGNAVSRLPFMAYLEALLFLVLIFFLISFSSSKGFLIRSVITIILIVLVLASVIGCISFLGIWLKSANIIFGLVVLYILLLIKSESSSTSKKDSETSRILGLNFQSQGELDLAYEEFKTLPLDKETKDLIYNLGLEYEKKNLPEKALELYAYINKSGGFKDLDDRIPMLRAADYSSTMGSYGDVEEASVLSDSSINARTMVGRYKILGKLGKGSMGLVYKAQDPKINRLVAIKTIRFSDEFDEDVIKEIKERFFMEAEIAGKLSHPSIVTIHDVGDDRDLTYMAMEYLEGEDLDKFIKKGSLLPVRAVLNVVSQIADALDFAHKQGVIHRDIKPANVMLLSNGQVKVTDFGIAKAISSSKTKTGVILGTPNYMSPEQIMGQKVNSKSDIFSLGVLFYQLLTGELPFHGDNLSGLLYQITQVKHSSPRGYNPKIPKICEQILDKALSKDPAKRFRTAGEMANIIRMLGDKMDQLKARKDAAE